MLYEYMVYPDGFHTAYSERKPDGTIEFWMEWPSQSGMGTARCTLPSMKWDELSDVDDESLAWLKAFVERNRDLIEEMADDATMELTLNRTKNNATPSFTCSPHHTMWGVAGLDAGSVGLRSTHR